VAFSAGSRLNAVRCCLNGDLAAKMRVERVNSDIDGLTDAHVGSCDSLKLAVTQMSSGTKIMIACPGQPVRRRPPTVSSRARRLLRAAPFAADRVGAIFLCLGLIELRRGADLLRVQDIDLRSADTLPRWRVKGGLLAIEVDEACCAR